MQPLKRKWDVTDGDKKGKKREEERIFKRSNKISRSPAEKRNKEDLRGILKELGQEMREGLKGVKEEISEMAKEQKEALREKTEKMKENLRGRKEGKRRIFRKR